MRYARAVSSPNPKRVLAFRHIPFEGLGLIHALLEERGISVEYPDLYLPGAPVPDITQAAGLIFMGGPMSVNDDLPWLHQELQLISRALERGQPVLGVCLGAQLIAKALGAKVYRNAVKEIGWFEIHLTEAGARDALFAGVGPAETVFHWHGETFDLPPGAEWLAWSEACRHQAFRAAAGVYGLQFHLEVTPGMIENWCAQDANQGDVRELNAPIDPRRNAARLVALSSVVFGRWCDLL
jgi:GMP synthase-like glutamine amidotransferase